ncbi:hypothetical protein HDV00_000327 [Rhizophlyctis rosea]|nr:hypothetical protein HDV00_000327 [Rhizophlyctis rosea]
MVEAASQAVANHIEFHPEPQLVWEALGLLAVPSVAETAQVSPDLAAHPAETHPDQGYRVAAQVEEKEPVPVLVVRRGLEARVFPSQAAAASDKAVVAPDFEIVHREEERPL